MCLGKSVRFFLLEHVFHFCHSCPKIHIIGYVSQGSSENGKSKFLNYVHGNLKEYRFFTVLPFGVIWIQEECLRRALNFTISWQMFSKILFLVLFSFFSHDKLINNHLLLGLLYNIFRNMTIARKDICINRLCNPWFFIKYFSHNNGNSSFVIKVNYFKNPTVIKTTHHKIY